jgi:hypothetical protein
MFPGCNNFTAAYIHTPVPEVVWKLAGRDISKTPFPVIACRNLIYQIQTGMDKNFINEIPTGCGYTKDRMIQRDFVSGRET